MQETRLSKDDTRITRIEITEEDYSARYGFVPSTEDEKVFFGICSAVRQCGEAARANQALIHRSFKEDGSILTETDLAVSEALIGRLRTICPQYNIITEEIDLHDFSDDRRYTFVLDPIDGTDAYSQGLPAWCVALGILDQNRKPCGAVIYAPRFGVGTQDLFICSMPDDERVFLNGKLLRTPEHYDVPRQMLMGSNTLSFMDMRAYKGKLRTFGSSIIHEVAPAVFSNIDCTLNQYCYAWDVCAAHAIAVKSGLEICYYDLSEIEYDDVLLIERKQVRLPILVGNANCVKWMHENLIMY